MSTTMSQYEQAIMQAKFDCLNEGQKNQIILWSIEYDQSVREILSKLSPDYVGGRDEGYYGMIGMLPYGVHGTLWASGYVETIEGSRAIARLMA